MQKNTQDSLKIAVTWRSESLVPLVYFVSFPVSCASLRLEFLCRSLFIYSIKTRYFLRFVDADFYNHLLNLLLKSAIYETYNSNSVQCICRSYIGWTKIYCPGVMQSLLRPSNFVISSFFGIRSLVAIRSIMYFVAETPAFSKVALARPSRF